MAAKQAIKEPDGGWEGGGGSKKKIERWGGVMVEGS